MHVFDLMSLQGKKALVTGGGRGLGRQIAIGLAEAGADITIGSRRLENCQQVADEIIATTGRKAYAVELDVLNKQSIEGGVSKSLDRMGRIDILVNNAGIAWGAPVLDMPEEQWDRVFDVNAKGTFLMCQAVGRHMIENQYGRIVNISSITGLYGFHANVLDAIGYSASKGAVVSLTRDLAVKWAEFGIIVNAIAPGFFPSKLTRDVLDNGGQEILKGTPMNRFGGDDDLKGLVVYLSSNASAYMTGQICSLDGGASAF